MFLHQQTEMETFNLFHILVRNIKCLVSQKLQAGIWKHLKFKLRLNFFGTAEDENQFAQLLHGSFYQGNNRFVSDLTRHNMKNNGQIFGDFSVALCSQPIDW